jgi:flagellar biosynthetic protein FlhB
MAESDSGEKTLDASAQRLQQARDDGDVAVSREGAVAGIYLAALLATVLIAGPMLRRVSDLLLPLLDQPEAFLDSTDQGLAASGRATFMAIGLALAPLFGLLIAGSLLPYILQNAVVVSRKRISPKLSHLSPKSGFKRMFGQRAFVEFAKSLSKLIAIGLTCWIIARPLYNNSIGLVSTDFSILPDMLRNSVVAILSVATVVATVIAGIDIPYQHWSHRRRLRMSFQDMRDEFRSSEGDPHTKNRQRKVRRERLRNRMLLEVPAATVVITNPTHFAVALRYERGRDSAPVVVAKGADLIAQKIREIAFENQVAIVENPPLARALYSAVDIGEMIPQEYFEMAAKIIGLVWSRAGRNQAASGASRGS